ncbi:hypothetical protein [Faecalimonas sp.]
MDKHEYRVKTEQMLDYMAKKQYKKAMEIADTIDWHRVKSLSMLSNVSEIYEYNGENQKSRDILFIAYDRSPGSRKIVYRLGTLAIKINDLQEAMDCYKEFLSIAPKDPNQYILKYKLLKAENAPVEEQIEALVDFKKMEYVEKWAYELAKLYEEAGMIVECLEECDDLILWFSEGKYVLKAMELKIKHKPLTPLQQEKYDRFMQRKEEAKKAKENLEATRKIEISKDVIESMTEEKVEEPAEEKQEEKVEEPVEEKQEEKVEEPVEEKQEEKVEEPVEEKQEEKVEEPVEEKQEEKVEEPVEEKQEEKVEEPVEEKQEEKVEEPAEEKQEEDSIIKETVVGSTLEEAVAKGVAAAVHVTAKQNEEESMSAQEKLEGILQNWEETQRNVEKEIEKKKQQAEAEREARRKERVEQSMFNTTPIIPDDIQQLLDDLEREMKETDSVEIDEVAQEMEPTESVGVQEENTDEASESEELEEEVVEESVEIVEPVEEVVEVSTDEVEKEVVEESAEELVVQPEEEVANDFVEDFADDDDIIEKQFDISFQEEEEQETEKDAELEQLQNEMKAETNEDSEGVSFDTGFIVQGKYDLEAQSEIGLKAGLTEEQKKLFSYFVPVRGMSEQIVEVLENDKNCNTRYGTSRTGNILVVGRQGTGKTVLAVNVVKAIQKARRLKQGKVAIVTGDALNRKDLSTVLGKLKGGALIVEKAGKMNRDTIEELNERMEEQTGELLVVLEEQRKPLEKLLSENTRFRRKFTSKLELPIFINDELVTFGQTYAKENGYKIDEMGILALYSRIDILQKEDHAVTVTEVKEILDHAIEKAQRVNLKHFFKRLFGKHTDNADRVILTEQDFK